MLDETDNILNITKTFIHKSIIHSQICKRKIFRKTLLYIKIMKQISYCKWRIGQHLAPV